MTKDILTKISVKEAQSKQSNKTHKKSEQDT